MAMALLPLRDDEQAMVEERAREMREQRRYEIVVFALRLCLGTLALQFVTLAYLLADHGTCR